MSIDSEFRGPIKARKLSEMYKETMTGVSDTSMTMCESLFQLYLNFELRQAGMSTGYDQGDKMPAWAAAMERRLTRQMVEITEDLKDDVASIEGHLTSIDGQLNGMTNRLIRIEINAARTINFSCGDGTCRPYELVPSSDGKYLHNLLELRTAQDLRNLNDVQLNRYLKGYGLEFGHDTARNEKLALLCRYIGGSLE